ncbi:MAG: 50S ribosomal protein L20 [Candidatus Margulisbacteria bacterium]|nr:50S ribosomal protein L20 [Candidatus Margulisiibacteriota bacterium]MBU1021730.1 50S ribosomal protein L20 [Candidatus Margulisiibacteriota bacterium]MBU1729476.1 50S ribosomal protein L20 [Candidatus Margulisiibacteriota bacterium]MBU1955423.1 50S ribosomal protein L20 [Candidatus Margulisiibacteriota bacterium]
MVRVKRGNVARKRKKKLFKSNKGYRGTLKNVFRAAKQADTKAKTHATRHRKEKKRTFRGLWIARISAAAKMQGISYSQLIGKLKKANIRLDRKILADIAATDMPTFAKLVEKVKVAA